MTSSVRVCLGSMEYGRYASEEAALAMTQLFVKHGHNEIDTALMYAGGVTQEILGRMRSNDQSLKSATIIHTKLNPWRPNRFDRESMNHQMNVCLKALQIEPTGHVPSDQSKDQPPIDILYLHAPDHEVPLIETLETMNEFYQRGIFKRFGLSNYAAWQVAQIHGICVKNSFVLPTVYQGMYNVLTRAVEPELFPCLRAHNMSFYAYNPLAGGVLTGKYTSINSTAEGNRFADNDWAAAYRARFFRPDIFEALDRLRNVLAKESEPCSMTEASLRWMMHHSQLKGALGDAVIIGASKEEHVSQNLIALAKGPLSDSIVKAFDDCAALCKPNQPAYFR